MSKSYTGMDLGGMNEYWTANLHSNWSETRQQVWDPEHSILKKWIDVTLISGQNGEESDLHTRESAKGLAHGTAIVKYFDLRWANF